MIKNLYLCMFYNLITVTKSVYVVQLAVFLYNYRYTPLFLQMLHILVNQRQISLTKMCL